MWIMGLLLAMTPATLGTVPLPEMLVSDDECASGEGGTNTECVLNALQRQARGTSSGLESRAEEFAEESGSDPKKVQTDLTIPHRKLLHKNLTKFQGEILSAWKKIQAVGKNINATKAKVDKCVYGEKLAKNKQDEQTSSDETSATSDGASEGGDDDSDEEVDWSFPALLQQDKESAAKHRRRYHEPKRIARTRTELSYEYQELKIFWDTFNYIRKTTVYVKQLMDSNRLPRVQHDLTDFDIPDGLADPDSEGGPGGFPDFEDPDSEDPDEGDDEGSEESSEGSDSETSGQPGSASSGKPGGAATTPKVHHEHRRRRRTVPDYKQLKTDVSKIDEQLVDIGHQMEEIQGVVDEAADKVSNYCEAKHKLAEQKASR